MHYSNVKEIFSKNMTAFWDIALCSLREAE
jgi:hypothetical protein